MNSRTGFDLLRGSESHNYELIPDTQKQYTDVVVAPLLSELTAKLVQDKPSCPRSFLSSYLGSDTFYTDMMVFDQCVYFLSVVSAAMFLLWIGWMPLLKILAPDLVYETDTPTITISDTFSRHNVVATIYIVGPLSMLFLMRVYTTLRCEHLTNSERTKKFVCIVLVLSQYSMFVVIRFDAITGNAHIVATFLTFLLLLVYHFYTHHSMSERAGNVLGCPLKLMLGVACTVCILLFACFVVWVEHPDKHTGLWVIAVVLEIAGVLFLGAMDMVDIYDLGSRLEDTHPDPAIARPPTNASTHPNPPLYTPHALPSPLPAYTHTPPEYPRYECVQNTYSPPPPGQPMYNTILDAKYI